MAAISSTPGYPGHPAAPDDDVAAEGGIPDDFGATRSGYVTMPNPLAG